MLTIVAVELLRLPYLKIVGAVSAAVDRRAAAAAAKTMTATHRGAVGSLVAAIKTILMADLVMSLDNVIAVAAAAKGNNALLIIGLAISHPARSSSAARCCSW